MSSKYPSADLMQAAHEQASEAQLYKHGRCFSAQCLLVSNALAKAYAAGFAAAAEPRASRYHDLIMQEAADPDPLKTTP